MKLSPRCHADSEPGAAVHEQKIKNFNLSGQMADDVMTVRILGELSRPMSRSLYLLSLSMPLCLWSFQAKAMDPDLGQFLYAKQQQIRHFSDTADKRIPGIIWRFYDAAGVEDIIDQLAALTPPQAGTKDGDGAEVHGFTRRIPWWLPQARRWPVQ